MCYPMLQYSESCKWLILWWDVFTPCYNTVNHVNGWYYDEMCYPMLQYSESCKWLILWWDVFTPCYNTVNHVNGWYYDEMCYPMYVSRVLFDASYVQRDTYSPTKHSFNSSVLLCITRKKQRRNGLKMYGHWKTWPDTHRYMHLYDLYIHWMVCTSRQNSAKSSNYYKYLADGN